MNRWMILKETADDYEFVSIAGPATEEVDVVPESVLLAERARSAKLAEALREIVADEFDSRTNVFHAYGIARAALVEYEEGTEDE